jgi:hypothetical protein
MSLLKLRRQVAVDDRIRPGLSRASHQCRV